MMQADDRPEVLRFDSLTTSGRSNAPPASLGFLFRHPRQSLDLLVEFLQVVDVSVEFFILNEEVRAPFVNEVIDEHTPTPAEPVKPLASHDVIDAIELNQYAANTQLITF